MRRLLPFLLFALAALPSHAAELERGKVVDGLACASDPSQTYAVYLPTSYQPGQHRPLLLVFDPRRRGAFAAELFREAAEQYGWIVASSNDTRSDETWAPNEIAVKAMLPDVLQRFSPDPRRIYATGFSGGAMVAWWLAQRTNGIAGIIACSGRLADPHDADKVSFDWYGTAGDRDFNYGETRSIDAKLEAIHAKHRIAIFDGPHRWAPKEVLAEAVGWMELQAMRRGSRPRDEALIRRLLDADLAAAKGLDAQPLAQLGRYEAIARTFEGLTPLDTVRTTIAALTASPAVARARKDETRDDEFEAAYRLRIPTAIDDFLHADDPQPAVVLAHDLDLPHLQKLAKEPGSRGITAQRVLETIAGQVGFYLPRDLLAHKNYGLAASILGIACEIHPDRPDLHYDHACASAQAKRKREALDALELAVAHGYRDAAHAAADPDLLSLHGDRRFEELLGRMKL
jgi:dienelactone hydrolase